MANLDNFNFLGKLAEIIVATAEYSALSSKKTSSFDGLSPERTQAAVNIAAACVLATAVWHRVATAISNSLQLRPNLPVRL